MNIAKVESKTHKVTNNVHAVEIGRLVENGEQVMIGDGVGGLYLKVISNK